MLEKCKRGVHELEEIYRVFVPSPGQSEEEVVRWCRICGAIVVDKEYDCRLRPGAVIKMKWPEITKKAVKEE